jgi:hypothetical protein
MRAEKLELASPTSSSKNEPTTVEYLELERQGCTVLLWSQVFPIMNVKQMSFACLKVELCAFERVLRYVLTDSSTHTLKIPPMNVTAVTDHCSTKCYRQWGQRLSKVSSDHNLFQHSHYNLLANWKVFMGWFSGLRVLMLLLWMHSPMHSCASGTREYLVKKITHHASSRISIWWIRDVQ